MPDPREDPEYWAPKNWVCRISERPKGGPEFIRADGCSVSIPHKDCHGFPEYVTLPEITVSEIDTKPVGLYRMDEATLAAIEARVVAYRES
jgi:hypothetical protein